MYRKDLESGWTSLVLHYSEMTARLCSSTRRQNAILSSSNGWPADFAVQYFGPTTLSVTPIIALSNQKCPEALHRLCSNPPLLFDMIPNLVSTASLCFMPARNWVSMKPNHISVKPTSSLCVIELPQFEQKPRYESGPEANVLYVVNDDSSGFIMLVGTWKLCGTNAPLNLLLFEHWHEALLPGGYDNGVRNSTLNAIEVHKHEAVIESGFSGILGMSLSKSNNKDE